MKIIYKPLRKTVIEQNMSKRQLYLQTKLTMNHIDNMGKGEYISITALIKICEAFNCNIVDVIAVVADDDP